MSGINQVFMIGIGLAAAAFSVFVVRRMDDAADTDRLEIRLNTTDGVANPVHFPVFKAHVVTSQLVLFDCIIFLF